MEKFQIKKDKLKVILKNKKMMINGDLFTFIFIIFILYFLLIYQKYLLNLIISKQFLWGYS